MGIRGAVWLALALALALGACVDPDAHEGDPCRIVFEGEVSGCAAGLFCSPIDARCHAPSEEGESCGEQCATGLFCGLDETCQAPQGEGAPCRVQTECAGELICNGGYLPDDEDLGECRPPSGVGEPCAYGQWASVDVTPSIGCSLGLTCLPTITVTWESIVTYPDDARCLGGNCFAGVCGEIFSVPIGESCLGDAACSDGGFCNAIPLPVAELDSPGFLCGDGDCVLASPWPGLCAPDSLTPTNLEACTTTPCAPGFLCNDLGVCHARWQGSLLDECDTYGTGVLDDDFCALGRHCDADTMQCEEGFPL